MPCDIACPLVFLKMLWRWTLKSLTRLEGVRTKKHNKTKGHPAPSGQFPQASDPSLLPSRRLRQLIALSHTHTHNTHLQTASFNNNGHANCDSAHHALSTTKPPFWPLQADFAAALSQPAAQSGRQPEHAFDYAGAKLPICFVTAGNLRAKCIFGQHTCRTSGNTPARQPFLHVAPRIRNSAHAVRHCLSARVSKDALALKSLTRLEGVRTKKHNKTKGHPAPSGQFPQASDPSLLPSRRLRQLIALSHTHTHNTHLQTASFNNNGYANCDSAHHALSATKPPFWPLQADFAAALSQPAQSVLS